MLYTARTIERLGYSSAEELLEELLKKYANTSYQINENGNLLFVYDLDTNFSMSNDGWIREYS